MRIDPGMRLLGRLTILLLLLAGCSAGQQAPSQRAEPGDASAVSVTAPQPGVDPAKQQPGSDPVANSCAPLTSEKATELLVRFASVSPEERVNLTTGEAQKLARSDAESIRRGWPPGELGHWMADLWVNLSLSPGRAQNTLIELTSRTFTDFITRFDVQCENGWKVTRIGTDFRWYEATPTSVQGQDGPLTTDLVLKLAQDAYSYYSTPHMWDVSTGAELETARRIMVLGGTRAAGRQVILPPPTSRLEFQPESETRVVVQWQNPYNSNPPEKLLFLREQGLWKLADHTDKDVWISSRLSELDRFRSVDQEDQLNGIALGMNWTEAQTLTAQDSDVAALNKGRISRLEAADDTMGSIAIRSGATARSLRIGDPPDQVQRLYGPPTATTESALIYRGSKRQMEFKLQKDASGVQRVVEIRLTRLGQ